MANSGEKRKAPAGKQKGRTQAKKPRIETTVDDHVAVLSKAAKKARTFESQKLIRKLKKLKEEESETSTAQAKELDEQLEQLKSIEAAEIINYALRSYYNKQDPRTPEMTAFLEAHSATLDTDTAQGKAINRVLANKLITEATSSLPPLATKGKAKRKAEPEEEKPAKKVKPNPVKEQATTSSSFLPSLAVGYTFGDSDAEDDYEMPENEGEPKRKNRRGQRARQAIWERKFGNEANHVKKSEQAEALAQATKEAKKLQRVKKGREPLPEVPKEQRRVQPVKDEKMHPSWEAKKKAQELVSLAATGGAQGKKIVFA